MAVQTPAPKVGTPRITFDELIAKMVREDFKSTERDELATHHGYKTTAYHE